MDVEHLILLTLDAGPKSHEGILKSKCSSQSGQLENRWEVDSTGTRSCQIAGYGIVGVSISDSVTRELVNH